MGLDNEVPKEDVDTNVNWDDGTVTFRTTAINGVKLINPPSVRVPILLILRLAVDGFRVMLPPQFQRMSFLPRPQQFQPGPPPSS